MSFFKPLEALLTQSTSALFTVTKAETEGEIAVTISPLLKNGKPINPNIIPLTLTGTPEELDERFFETLSGSAFSRAISLAVNMDEFNAAIEGITDTDESVQKSGEGVTGELMRTLDAMRTAMQEFVDRCDKGEIKSEKTYAQFKEILAGVPQTKPEATGKTPKAPKPPKEKKEKPKSHANWMKEGNAAMADAMKAEGEEKLKLYVTAVTAFTEADTLQPNGRAAQKLALAKQWESKVREMITDTPAVAVNKKEEPVTEPPVQESPAAPEETLANTGVAEQNNDIQHETSNAGDDEEAFGA